MLAAQQTSHVLNTAQASIEFGESRETGGFAWPGVAYEAARRAIDTAYALSWRAVLLVTGDAFVPVLSLTLSFVQMENTEQKHSRSSQTQGARRVAGPKLS